MVATSRPMPNGCSGSSRTCSSTRAASEQRVDLEPQVLGHAIRRVVGIFQRHHPERRVDLDVQDDDLIIDADQGYLELLVGNFLGNADKYSLNGHLIDVTVRRAGRERT